MTHNTIFKTLLVFLLLLALLLPGCSFGPQGFFFREWEVKKSYRVPAPEFEDWYDFKEDYSEEQIKEVATMPYPHWLIADAYTYDGGTKDAQLRAYNPAKYGQKPTEMACSATYQGLTITAYKISSDSPYYDYENQIFTRAKAGALPAGDVSRLPGEHTGKEEILLEDRVFIYQDGVLQGFVMKLENGLAAIEYSDAPLAAQRGRQALEGVGEGFWQTRQERGGDPACEVGYYGIYLHRDLWEKNPYGGVRTLKECVVHQVDKLIRMWTTPPTTAELDSRFPQETIPPKTTVAPLAPGASTEG